MTLSNSLAADVVILNKSTKNQQKYEFSHSIWQRTHYYIIYRGEVNSVTFMILILAIDKRIKL